jgi:hypothetical protein
MLQWSQMMVESSYRVANRQRKAPVLLAAMIGILVTKMKNGGGR